MVVQHVGWETARRRERLRPRNRLRLHGGPRSWACLGSRTSMPDTGPEPSHGKPVG
ncbi:hypothetical protein ACFOLD_08315 [Kocuria carniphila]|uniref:hypothetical protein n=1 Tax=Kocuria carniphila TaxID=262208 RepID=UPI003620F424